MTPEVRRHIGVAAGALLGAAAVLGLDAPGCEAFHAPGPMNPQHATIACDDCHRPAPGTVRQQLQTVARAWLLPDARASATVDVGFRAVTNAECLACHERAEDTHPVFRFLEPRFAAVRERLHPESCSACHREHAGVAITVAAVTFCRHCHDNIAIDHDPIDVPHRELAAAQRWETCLGCHDYHGNHAREAPHRVADAISIRRLQLYLDGGPSPYGAPVHRAKPEVTP